MKFYQTTILNSINKLKTNIDHGLSAQEVQKRLQEYGYNELPEGKQHTWLNIFIDQFKSPLIYILLAAATIIFFVGEDKLDAFVISGVLLFNAIIGTVQEGRTQNIIASLKRFIKTNCVVIRDGKKTVVEDKDLVPGDIILIQEGQRIPADARIIESNNLQVDESALTGESGTVNKTNQVITQNVPVANQNNMLFKGTYAMAGSAKAVVVGTGLNTEIGTIHKSITEIKTEIPLRKELDKLSYIILLFILGMCTLLFAIGIATGRPLQELLVMLTALFICVVPEGLPVVLTLVLVSGAYRMAREYVLAKNLQAVEALGRTDVIVIDKTGTLTRNEMIVTQVYADGCFCNVSGQGYYVEGDVVCDGKRIDETKQEHVCCMQAAIAAALLNNTEITYIPKLKLFDIKGDPTEAALYVFAQKLGLEKEQLEKEYIKIFEIPFDPDIKYHAGFFKKDSECIVFILGSPEVVMQQCSQINMQTQDALTNMLDEGLRVVACATKTIPFDTIPRDNLDTKEKMIQFKNLLKDNLKFVSFFGMQDSIRSEVRSVIEQTRNAGLHVVMATGDHKKTALYVAKKVGIYKKGDDSVDGSELDALSDKQLLARLDKITVFSRVSPEQKMRIIKLFHKEGKMVAMTGDGINDAPSLVAADVAIAMGNIGTEVAKESADMVLLNDSFVNIAHAIEQGRHIFYTLRRVILYFFATNMGEILIVFFALAMWTQSKGLPLPLTAVQILWLNLITDGFLDVSLSMEPRESGLLSRAWLKHKPKLVDWNMLLKMMYMALPMGIGALLVFNWYYTGPESVRYARTITLVTMAMFQWFNAWNCRSEKKSLFEIGFFTNKWLIAATVFVLFLQFVLLYVPIMQHIFKTVPLNLNDWLVVFAVSAPMVAVEEVRKWIVRKFYS